MSKSLKQLAFQDAWEILINQLWNVEDDRELLRLERRAKGHLKFFLENTGGKIA